MRIVFGRGNHRQSAEIPAASVRTPEEQHDVDVLAANILECTESPQDKLRRKGFKIYK